MLGVHFVSFARTGFNYKLSQGSRMGRNGYWQQVSCRGWVGNQGRRNGAGTMVRATRSKKLGLGKLSLRGLQPVFGPAAD